MYAFWDSEMLVHKFSGVLFNFLYRILSEFYNENILITQCSDERVIMTGQINVMQREK
jgi:hypothetical protein